MSEMYSVVCFFPWFPRNYDYVLGILSVFNISADQLVSVRKEKDNNKLIFSVASAEIFTRLQQFFCRVLFFPIFDRYILECFAYPQSPQYRFVKISAYPPINLTENLSALGTVLYHQYICREAPLTAEYKSNTIGVVILNPRAKQRPAGDGKQATAARAVPYVAAAVTGGAAFFTLAGGSAAALQIFPVPGYLHQQGTVLQPSVYLYPFQGQVFGFNGAYPYGGNLKRYWAPYGNRNCPKMGVFSPAQDPAEKECEDESLSEDASSEDQYQESSDEGEQEQLINKE